MADVTITICEEDIGVILLALKIEAHEQFRFGHPEKASRLEEYMAIIGEQVEEVEDGAQPEGDGSTAAAQD